ncbi:fatty-acid O-methyltransferase Mtf2 [Mycobacterium sp.]|uniref:fatty-acid O-methyltransferase Mtf2 n=1 Tax=Mycobacterium sp. TaxID=1785 RepID=UPI001274B95A|nr:class I SAM-dependent methyltransferase [Mycobacterium sp.]KAA8963880.1 MAG: class I SAM-dependent methyltransferase [Mycobacterium sp.]
MALKNPVFRNLITWRPSQRGQKYFYPYATRPLADEDVVFLNYGYEQDPPMALPLDPCDEPNRYCIQLYHRTATQVDLRGKRVLEVGCGHGGGASYLMRTLEPAAYTGLDLNPAGIAFCRKRHDLADLDFVRGDAENLPFPDQSFDAVINIESSLHYVRFPRFLAEVARVLRPGGHFLYADFRPARRIAAWEAALESTVLRMISRRVINAEVLRGMEKNSGQWLGRIDRHVPAPFRGFARDMAGVPAMTLYQEMQRGGLSYRMYCFAKP